MKRTYPQSISEVVQSLMRDSHMEDTMLQHRALAAWPRVVGPMINRQTVERRVASGTLYVRIPSAIIRSELSLNKATLLAALNAAAGATVLTQIKFI